MHTYTNTLHTYIHTQKYIKDSIQDSTINVEDTSILIIYVPAHEQWVKFNREVRISCIPSINFDQLTSLKVESVVIEQQALYHVMRMNSHTRDA